MRWIANFLSCWGAGMHRITSSWTATPKTAVGLLFSAPLNLQAKSPEQAYRISAVQGLHRTLNARSEHNNRRGRSRNAVHNVGTNLMLTEISALALSTVMMVALVIVCAMLSA
jgi:hypothetical protein